MGTVYSIRGTNGSGKTTLARAFLPPNAMGDNLGGPVDLNHYPSPTKKDPNRQLRSQGYVTEGYAAEGYVTEGWTSLGRVGVVGKYDAACGGMDRMPDFAVCRGAISYLLNELHCDAVIAEGLLASGVYGSWGVYAKELRQQGHNYAFCYLSTPLEICKERIKALQVKAGKVDKIINWSLVDAKYDQVISNRKIALANGEMVYDLPYSHEVHALSAIMRGEGDEYRAQ